MKVRLRMKMKNENDIDKMEKKLNISKVSVFI